MDREKQKKSRSGTEKRARRVQVNVRMTPEELERCHNLLGLHDDMNSVQEYIRYLLFGKPKLEE